MVDDGGVTPRESVPWTRGKLLSGVLALLLLTMGVGATSTTFAQPLRDDMASSPEPLAPQSFASSAEAGQSDPSPDLMVQGSQSTDPGGDVSLASLDAATTLPPSPVPPPNRLASLNGRFLMLNMHGALFHEDLYESMEDVAYAVWMAAGVIRVFATDNNGYKDWGGAQVGNRIADLAPTLRSANVKLIVALVNNHRAVPGEPDESTGWMDGYYQLLLPFYKGNWRLAYLPFAQELISTVEARGALDVIQAWELGNELHTPRDPNAIIPFINDVAQEIRRLDPQTPILPGTMGIHHLDPFRPDSPIGQWLACEAPLDGYTLHAYDWFSPEKPGDMPINLDFDYVLSKQCSSGRALPVIVEELGTSRELPGVYTGEQEEARLGRELEQIRYVLDRGPRVIGLGAWNAESPKLVDRTFQDNRRGLTSYGPLANGSGSGYLGVDGARNRIEQALRWLPRRP